MISFLFRISLWTCHCRFKIFESEFWTDVTGGQATEPSESDSVRGMFCLNPEQGHERKHEWRHCRGDERINGKNKYKKRLWQWGQWQGDWEILIRIAKSRDAWRDSQNTEKVGPRRAVQRDSDLFLMSDWGSAKGMYNYSLMNNASRILLISHTRPKCSNCSRQDKHVHMYIHMYTHTHSLQCYSVWVQTFGYVHPMRRLIHHETALSRMKNQSKQRKLQEDQLLANQCYGGTLPVVKLVISAGEFTLFLKPCLKSQEQSQDVGLNMHQWWHQWMMSSPQNLVRMKAMDGWMDGSQPIKAMADWRWSLGLTSVWHQASKYITAYNNEVPNQKKKHVPCLEHLCVS